MSKCHENRKARKKRDKKFLRKLAHMRLDSDVLQQRGVNPAYYRVVYHSLKVKKSRRQRYFYKVRALVLPNQKYIDLMDNLARLCGNVAVEIPIEMLNGTGPHSDDCGTTDNQ